MYDEKSEARVDAERAIYLAMGFLQQMQGADKAQVLDVTRHMLLLAEYVEMNGARADQPALPPRAFKLVGS